jgi:hypothetical protein
MYWKPSRVLFVGRNFGDYFAAQYDSLEMARATAEVGARGYISKVHIPTDLVPAIEAGVVFPPAEVKP